jgi:hypothetical protein
MSRTSFIFYKSFYDAIRELDTEQKAAVIDLILSYQFEDRIPDSNGIPKAIFALIVPQLDANNRKYSNGKKGGRPPKENPNETKPKPKNNLNKTKPKANVNENVNVNVNVKVNKDIYPCPKGVSSQMWDEFVKHRKRKDAAITIIAMQGIEREAKDAGYTIEQAIRTIIERNWTGFKAEWVAKDARTNSAGHGTGGARQPAYDNRSEGAKALDIAEQIIAKREAKWAEEDAAKARQGGAKAIN